MGQDDEAEARARALGAYQVNDDLMARADEAWFLHCLPARRGEEVSAEVHRGPAQRGLAAGREPHAHRARRDGVDDGGEA